MTAASSRGFPGRLFGLVLAPLLICGALRLALRAAGNAAMHAGAGAAGRAALMVVLFAAAVVAASAGALLVHRSTERPATRCAVAIAALFLFAAVAAAGTQAAVSRARRRERTHFGPLRVHPAATSHEEERPGMPRVRYEINRIGFRGPDGPRDPVPGVPRVALVGDSFVFGVGVAWEETLGECTRMELEARAANRRFELLNLGVAGDNLPSHVTLVLEATRGLRPDLVVLCLNLPDDLTPGDIQDQARLEESVSALSLARWAAGPGFGDWLWSRRPRPRSVGPAEKSLLRREHGRLRAARGAEGAPPLVVYSFFEADPRVVDAFASLPGATWVDGARTGPAHRLPDNHLNGAGNRLHAPRLAAAILAALPPGA